MIYDHFFTDWKGERFDFTRFCLLACWSNSVRFGSINDYECSQTSLKKIPRKDYSGLNEDFCEMCTIQERHRNVNLLLNTGRTSYEKIC